MRRIAWAVSGESRSLRAIMEAIDKRLIRAEVVVLVADRITPVEEVARSRAIPFRLLEPQGERFHPQLVEILAQSRPEWMGLTFNRLLSDDVVAFFSGRILNLHMSLLPMFPGFGALRRTLESGMRMAGVTIHLVDQEIDKGKIVTQATCPVTSRDNRESLGRRMFAVALPLLLQAVRSIGDNDLTYENHQLIWPRSKQIVGVPSSFPPTDADLVSFAAEYCARLWSGECQLGEV